MLAPNMLKNPKLMSILLESMIGEVLPNYMEPVLREAVADGSIRTDYPEELGGCFASPGQRVAGIP